MLAKNITLLSYLAIFAMVLLSILQGESAIFIDMKTLELDEIHNRKT